jgi:hypothetical protein
MLSMTNEEFDRLNERMLPRFFTINPDAATQFGMHDPYDWHLPNGGVKRLEGTLALLEEWLSSAEQISKASELSDDQNISLKVLRMSKDMMRFALEDYPLWKMFPDGLELPGWLLFLMIGREYAPYERRAEAMASRIAELPRYLKEFRARFDGANPVKAWMGGAISTCEGIPEYLDFIRDHSKDKVDSSILADLDSNIALAKQDIAVHLEWLKSRLDSATVEFGMGRDKFAKLMEIRGMGMTPDEMLDLALGNLQRLKDERAMISRNLVASGDPAEAKKSVESKCADTLEGVLEFTRSECERAKSYLKEKALASIDDTAALDIIETPKFLQSSVPTAALMMPAGFEKVQSGMYMVTRTKKPEDMKSLWNWAAVRNTVVHEAFPGHFHQGIMSNRKPWMHQLHHMLILPDTLIPAYETMEGWAHYCEKMMFDHGFCGTDMDAFAMNEFGLWRVCRVIFDVELAHRETTTDEMVEMFMRETGAPEDTAEDEVLGFSRTPGYGLSYMVGRHLVIEFRKELERDLGPRFDELRFHDLMAENGNLPFFLAREAVRKAFGLD